MTEEKAHKGSGTGTPRRDRITIGHIHQSGCTGCLMALADNYEGMYTLLDGYADLVYGLMLSDVRKIPKMDVAIVEGSVCIQDKLALEEIGEARRNSKVVIALGGCACSGNITRFNRGGQVNQPQHESHVPISDLIDVDIFIPGCAPTPQLFRNVMMMVYLVLKGKPDQKVVASKYLQPLANLAKSSYGSKASFNTLIQEVINVGLCIGCGSCRGACPVKAITMEYGKPQGARDMCINCGACFSQCPRSFYPLDVMNAFEGTYKLMTGMMDG
jgi:coenzyme F420 hydrogenase subunit gamma